MEETERIKKHYQDYTNNLTVDINSTHAIYNNQIVKERLNLFKQIIISKYKNTEKIKFMEIGAGAGSNIPFFNSLGIKDENIYANELVEDRSQKLKLNFPNITVLSGDALQIKMENAFDIVFQSTVFTSILDLNFKKKLSKNLWEMTKTGGMVLWYDFMYNSPNNKSVKGIDKSEIKLLFNDSKNIEFFKVTLAPPIGRRFQNWYSFLNSFSFLRTHVIAVIHK
ncbi:MAG TPA: class I SAM-dependent methyltransferase [Bacteroidia bacterium]|nr:class I SAM-dependent methyltransferase [Bacteroidia bacterium]